MIRLFETHKVRTYRELDGLWDFTPEKEGGDGLPQTYDERMPVPGCWEMHPDYVHYRGAAYYRKTIALERRTSLRLDFKGVSHTADVFFDGQNVGRHYNAYTPFSIVVPNAAPGEHEIVVRVDNGFSEASSLHVPNDYYSYGGITRTVVLEEIHDVFIERVQFTPFREAGEWRARIRVVFGRVPGISATVKLKVALADRELDFGEVDVGEQQRNEVEKEIAFPEVKAWRHDDPHLYLLHATLFAQDGVNPLDDLIERVGFREVKLQKQQLLLNGKPVFLKGFNRHEDHPHVGCAIPFALMVKDVQLLESAGANAVRTSHYPNDELFLDLCDERGLLVWEENHARGLSLEQMQNPLFSKQCADVNREMIERHYNHPSIVIWGLLNECASYTAEGRRYYQEQVEQIKSLDTSRPVTFAMWKPYREKCLDLADIVSWNLYSSWYEDEDVEERYRKIKRWSDENGGKNKPYIISEFGGGAIYGYRDPSRVKWTEERQAEILAQELDVYMKQPEITGVFIWQFSDGRVHEEEWALKRPRTKNNKGVVDEYRRPKMAYDTVKRLFRGE